MFPNQQGLSNEDVKQNQEKYGLNILPEKPPPSHLFLIGQQLKNPLVYVLLLAVLVTLTIGHYSDAVIISIAVFINTILGYIQESRASTALYALKRIVAHKATVLREGKRNLIDASQIVPGDIVILSQGSKIPADGKVTFANRFYVDESTLTGESVPVTKEVNNPVLMGTIVSSGQAIMQVETTGALTKMGTIAGNVQEKEDDTPLQKQLKGFSKQLVWIIGILTTLVFILGVLYKFSLTEIFVTSVALAVSSIPEGLLVSLTVVLAFGMQKILRHRGLVRKLSAAETLGGVTVICVDKTGTLTQGSMKVTDHVGNVEELAKQVLLANDLDDPIVISAFEWGRTIIKDFVSQHQRLDSIPFSPNERFFASLHRWSENKNIIFVNGAPELLVGWTNLSAEDKKEAITTIDSLTKQGKRIIGFARKEVGMSKKRLEIDDAKGGLTWIGMLAFTDPIRQGVKEALNETISAGIKTIVITGDYSKTSEYVLRELGISITNNELLTGDQLRKLSLEQVSQKVRSVKLFARTTPDQKLMIVEALKKNGEVVAMMGDGVNDAPALHKADIGIVVGDATDVAKETADLVLLDSNFSTIVNTIEEGRSLFENIRKIILYLMSDAFAEILVVIGGISIGLPLPITAAQILWINLISDGFPGLALTVDPNRADIMKEKPRKPQEKLVNKWMVGMIGIVSFTAGLIALLSFILVFKSTGDLVVARSMAFITLGLNSLVYVFSVRTLLTPFWKSKFFENRWLTAAVFLGIGLQILPFATSSLRNFFGLASLEPSYWITAFGLSIAMFCIVEVFKVGYKLNSAKSI
jgi:Ca2+-transporting ATPase